MWTLGIGGLRRGWYAPWQLIALIAVLSAIGAVQLWLWLGQRELGWVGRDWRALGIPLWRSFAFWQWTASAALLGVFGYFAWAKTVRRSLDGLAQRGVASGGETGVPASVVTLLHGRARAGIWLRRACVNPETPRA
jgi:hypothetical protein